MKVLRKNNPQLDLAMQPISYDQTVRSDTVWDLKDINTQSLKTQNKKRKQLVSLMPAIKKALGLNDDDMVEISTKKGALENKKTSYDEKWLKESKTKLLKQIDD